MESLAFSEVTFAVAFLTSGVTACAVPLSLLSEVLFLFHELEEVHMQMTAVYVCVRILCEAIAGWPLLLYRSDMDGSRKKAPIPWFRYRISVRLTMPVCSYYVTDTEEESIWQTQSSVSGWTVS